MHNRPKAFLLANFFAVASFVPAVVEAAADAAPLRAIAPVLEAATKAAKESNQPKALARVASLARLAQVLDQAVAGDARPANALVANDEGARYAIVGMLLGVKAFDVAASLAAQDPDGELIVSVANAQISAGDRPGALRTLAAFAPSATADGWKPVYSPGILLSLPLENSWVSSLVKCGDLPAALEAAKSVRAPGARAFALVGVANALTAAKDLANARRALTAALVAARLQASVKTDLQRSPGAIQLWDGCRIAMISSAMRRAGDPEAGHVAADAISFVLRIQDEEARCGALARLGNVWWLAGDPADARRAFDAAHGEAAKIADPGRRYTADWSTAMTQAQLGDYEGSANAMLPHANWEQSLTRFVDDGAFPKTPADARRFITAYENASLSSSTSAARMTRIRAAAKLEEDRTPERDLRFKSLRIADGLQKKDDAETVGLVLAYLEAGDLNGAQTALDRAGYRSSALRSAALKMATAWLNAGQFARAAEMGKRAHIASGIDRFICALYARGRIADADAILETPGIDYQVRSGALYARAQALAASGKPDAARDLLAGLPSFKSPETMRRLPPAIAILWAHKDVRAAGDWAATLDDVGIRADALAGVVAAALDDLDPTTQTPEDPNPPRPANPLTQDRTQFTRPTSYPTSVPSHTIPHVNPAGSP